MAPLTASDRSWRLRWPPAGARRPLALGVVVGLIVLVGVGAWRMGSLDGLPDVGDPFDLAEVRRLVEVPDADNAYVAFEAAHRQLVNPKNPTDEARQGLLYGVLIHDAIPTIAWSSAPPDIRTYLEARRPALETWREGSRRRDALSHQPGQISFDTVLSLIHEALLFAGLAALEGSRLEEAGAEAEAWDWYRAMLRSSRLVGRHACLVERHFGARMHALAARAILRWAADPRVGAELLRQALDDTLAADALTPPLSDAIKIDYRMFLDTLEDMTSIERSMRGTRGLPLLGGRKEGPMDRIVPMAAKVPIQRIRLRARNDVERTRRVARLLYANWLAQVDRPAARRAPLAVKTPAPIYANDPSAPPAARALSPESLARAIDQTEIGRLWFESYGRGGAPIWEGRDVLALEPRRRAVLIVRLAAELYRREHGAAPANTGALLGTTLKELPEGIDADDPIPAGLD